MKFRQAAILILVLSNSALFAQIKKPNKGSDLYRSPNSPSSTLHLGVDDRTTDLLTPTASVVPSDIGNRFNEGLFTAKEQVHDLQLTDLSGRVSTLEGRSNFLSGAFWAIGIVFAILITLLKVFWRGIVKVVLAEGAPRG